MGRKSRQAKSLERRRYPLVEIEWEDARFFEGWSTVEGDAAAARTARCRSWGVLVKKSEEHLTIAQTISTEGMKADLLTLPISMVRRIKVLKDVEDPEE